MTHLTHAVLRKVKHPASKYFVHSQCTPSVVWHSIRLAHIRLVLSDNTYVVAQIQGVQRTQPLVGVLLGTLLEVGRRHLPEEGSHHPFLVDTHHQLVGDNPTQHINTLTRSTIHTKTHPIATSLWIVRIRHNRTQDLLQAAPV